MRFIFILLLFNGYNKLSTVKSQGYFCFSWSKIKDIFIFHGRKSRIFCFIMAENQRMRYGYLIKQPGQARMVVSAVKNESGFLMRETGTGKKIRWMEDSLPVCFVGNLQIYTHRGRTSGEGDHICYISDLTRMKQHYPDWGISKNLQTIFEEIYAAWERGRK
jgi:hypothetical protein